jgi:hypothetical protein
VFAPGCPNRSRNLSVPNEHGRTYEPEIAPGARYPIRPNSRPDPKRHQSAEALDSLRMVDAYFSWAACRVIDIAKPMASQVLPERCARATASVRLSIADSTSRWSVAKSSMGVATRKGVGSGSSTQPSSSTSSSSHTGRSGCAGAISLAAARRLSGLSPCLDRLASRRRCSRFICCQDYLTPSGKLDNCAGGLTRGYALRCKACRTKFAFSRGESSAALNPHSRPRLRRRPSGLAARSWLAGAAGHSEIGGIEDV